MDADVPLETLSLLLLFDPSPGNTGGFLLFVGLPSLRSALSFPKHPIPLQHCQIIHHVTSHHVLSVWAVEFTVYTS